MLFRQKMAIQTTQVKQDECHYHCRILLSKQIKIQLCLKILSF